MAIFHLSATPVQRSRGHSAVAAAAYRAGDKLYDSRTGEFYDYGRKQGVLESAIIAPENAPDWVNDREELWNRAELAEKRKDAQPAREVRLALPSELTDEQRADLVFDYCRDAFVKNGMIADISIHRPDSHGDDRNHHAHILLTMREIEGEEFAGKKQRAWNSEEMLQGWRKQWAEYQNNALEAAGLDIRVDHRSLSDQGITDRLPQEHRGKGEHMERDGRESDRVQEFAQDAELYAELQDEYAQVIAELESLDYLEAGTELESAEEGEVRDYSDSVESVDVSDGAASSDKLELLEPEGEGTQSGNYPDKLQSEQLELGSNAENIEEVFHNDAAASDWEERKQASQTAFATPISEEISQDIETHGEVSQFWVAKHWLKTTIERIESIFHHTGTFIKDTWDKYVLQRNLDDHDRDGHEAGKDDMDYW